MRWMVRMAAAQRHSYETAPPTRLTAPRISEARAAPRSSRRRRCWWTASGSSSRTMRLGAGSDVAAGRAAGGGGADRKQCLRMKREIPFPFPLQSNTDRESILVETACMRRRLLDCVDLLIVRSISRISGRCTNSAQSQHALPLCLCGSIPRASAECPGHSVQIGRPCCPRVQRVRADLLHVVLERHVLPLELLLKLCQLRVLHHIPRVVLLPRHRPPRMKLEALPMPPRIP